jgi:hypothetical protein
MVRFFYSEKLFVDRRLSLVGSAAADVFCKIVFFFWFVFAKIS